MTLKNQASTLYTNHSYLAYSYLDIEITLQQILHMTPNLASALDTLLIFGGDHTGSPIQPIKCKKKYIINVNKHKSYKQY